MILKLAPKFIIRIISWILSKNCPWKTTSLLAIQPLCVNNKSSSQLEVGENVSVGSYNSTGFFALSYIFLRKNSKGITIGNNTKIGNCLQIISDCKVKIGERCLIGNEVVIVDSNFHSLDIRRCHKSAKKKEVVIGNNVFIGNRVLILKGVTIPDNSVIGAGSVVSRDLNESGVYAGNPVKKINEI